MVFSCARDSSSFTPKYSSRNIPRINACVYTSDASICFLRMGHAPLLGVMELLSNNDADRFAADVHRFRRFIAAKIDRRDKHIVPEDIFECRNRRFQLVIDIQSQRDALVNRQVKAFAVILNRPHDFTHPALLFKLWVISVFRATVIP